MAMVPQGEYVPPEAIYRFAGVEADAAARRLYIDGKERSCSHRVFNLLLALCEEPGRVHTRDELFARLWPDGRFPADESLSQLIFRLRTALGRYNSVLVTVRHVGVRLDAEVQREVRADASVRSPPSGELTQISSSEPASHVPAVEVRESAVPTRWWRRAPAKLGATAAVLAMIGVAVWQVWPSDPSVDVGWGLRESDMMASRADTAATMREALSLDATNDRGKALLLLEAMHQADPTTPIPSMFLGMWKSLAGEVDVGKQWFAQSSQRIGTNAPHYVRLLNRYMSEEAETSDAETLKRESLLLGLRPEAWQLRLARAHTYLLRNQRADALADLKLIPITWLDERRMALTLGDRASLGDADGAEALLATVPAHPDSSVHPYVTGRIQFARGDYAAARSSFDEAAAIARRTERVWQRLTSELHAASISAELGEWSDARERLRRLRTTARDEGWGNRALGASLLLLALPNHSPEERTREYEDLVANYTQLDPYSCVCVELVLGMLVLRTPESLRCDLEDMPESAGTRGQRALLTGLRALADGDRGTARDQLDRAQAAGVQETVLAPFADVLSAALGQTVAVPPPPDPPYPFWERYAARWHLRAAADLHSTQL